MADILEQTCMNGSVVIACLAEAWSPSPVFLIPVSGPNNTTTLTPVALPAPPPPTPASAPGSTPKSKRQQQRDAALEKRPAWDKVLR